MQCQVSRGFEILMFQSTPLHLKWITHTFSFMSLHSFKYCCESDIHTSCECDSTSHATVATQIPMLMVCSAWHWRCDRYLTDFYHICICGCRGFLTQKLVLWAPGGSWGHNDLLGNTNKFVSSSSSSNSTECCTENICRISLFCVCVREREHDAVMFGRDILTIWN